MRGALMVCGTASNAGKSHVVAGLCRALLRQGVRFTPAGTAFGDAREAQLDQLGDLIEDHVDLAAIQQLIEMAA